MKIGFIGLGKMGQTMVEHLLEGEIEVVVYNRTQEKVRQLKSKNAQNEKLTACFSLKEFIAGLESPRIIWLMVEHGNAVDDVIQKLLKNGLTKDDIVIDGGNSFYKDSVKRYQYLREKGIHFLDVGTSGGLEGARNGACLMVGGDRKIFERVLAFLQALAGKTGDVTYFGEAGAGHFVKMVHNGVEYGMLQAIGEGFEMLNTSLYKPDLQAVAVNWSKGSVVRGWLMELLVKAFGDYPDLEQIDGVIGGGSTGKWTLATAQELNMDVPVIKASMEARKKSQKKPTFSGKVVAALRNEFGGHDIVKK